MYWTNCTIFGKLDLCSLQVETLHRNSAKKIIKFSMTMRLRKDDVFRHAVARRMIRQTNNTAHCTVHKTRGQETR